MRIFLYEGLFARFYFSLLLALEDIWIFFWFIFDYIYIQVFYLLLNVNKSLILLLVMEGLNFFKDNIHIYIFFLYTNRKTQLENIKFINYKFNFLFIDLRI